MQGLIAKIWKDYSGALQIAFTAVLLGLLVRAVGWRNLLEGLSAVRWPWLLANYAAVTLTFLAMGVCLRLVLVKLGVKISVGRVLLANALANLYALVLPGDLMAGVSKWGVLAIATGERVKVLAGIVLNKLVLGLSPLVFGAFALAFASPFPSLPVAETAVAVAGAVLASIALVLHPRGAEWVDDRLRAASRAAPSALQRPSEKLHQAFSALRTLGARDHLELLSLSLLIFWLGILSFFCATRALGLNVSIAMLVWISLALFIARLLPITLNNLGVREGLLVLALGASQVEPALAVGVGLVMFSSAIWVGLLGAGCQLAIALGRVRLDPTSAPP